MSLPNTVTAGMTGHLDDHEEIHQLINGGTMVTSSDIDSIVKLTQAAYDALTPDSRTLYVISG